MQETLDDEITRLEHGIDRIAAHDSLQTKSAVSKEDMRSLRSSLKTRLQHYLSREEAILDGNPEIGSARLFVWDC